jgi:hypothetical protein
MVDLKVGTMVDGMVGKTAERKVVGSVDCLVDDLADWLVLVAKKSWHYDEKK